MISRVLPCEITFSHSSRTALASVPILSSSSLFRLGDIRLASSSSNSVPSSSFSSSGNVGTLGSGCGSEVESSEPLLSNSLSENVEDLLDISGLDTVVKMAPAVFARPRGGREAMLVCVVLLWRIVVVVTKTKGSDR
jgi:hypothetical protein